MDLRRKQHRRLTVAPGRGVRARPPGHPLLSVTLRIAPCPPTLRMQDNEIVKVTSPHDGRATRGHLRAKGRFGHQYIQNRD
ncbi:hypothetical protein B1R27_32340 [Streptomyces sp. GKU 895]|nr:hypothetical protein B1R27_32340 [Streptomyces sp. GKU 895]